MRRFSESHSTTDIYIYILIHLEESSILYPHLLFAYFRVYSSLTFRKDREKEVQLEGTFVRGRQWPRFWLSLFFVFNDVL